MERTTDEELLDLISDNIRDRMNDWHDTELDEFQPGRFPQITHAESDTEATVTLKLSNGRKIQILVTFDDDEPDTNGPDWGLT